jgi:hypothetical protein
MVHYKTLFQHLSRGTEEKQGNSQSDLWFSG